MAVRRVMVEAIFRSMKSLLATRPIYHRAGYSIRGHVFCSFLALILRQELVRRVEEDSWTLDLLPSGQAEN